MRRGWGVSLSQWVALLLAAKHAEARVQAAAARVRQCTERAEALACALRAR
jgi:hypothetical protein